MYGIEKHVLLSFCLQNMALKNTSLCHSVFKESNLMSLCMALRTMSLCHSVFKESNLTSLCMSLRSMSLCHYVFKESNLMSLCMASKSMSLCHSVFKIWHWETRLYVILSKEYQGPSMLFLLLSPALHQAHRSSTHSYMQHVSGASYPLVASHEPDQGTH